MAGTESTPGAEPNTSTVWMVNGTTGSMGWKGQLALDGSELVFRPDGAGRDETRVAAGEIRRARRVLGSPVLEIHLVPGPGPRIMGFYFIKPPSMAPLKGMHMFRQRYARKAATERLREWNPMKKEEIAGWVKAIKQAASNRT